MISWRRQKGAAVGVFTLPDGVPANVVLVAGRDNPRGAMVLVRDAGDGSVVQVTLAEALPRLDCSLLIAILCMQERLFGENELPSPAFLVEA